MIYILLLVKHDPDSAFMILLLPLVEKINDSIGALLELLAQTLTKFFTAVELCEEEKKCEFYLSSSLKFSVNGTTFWNIRNDV